MVIYFFKKFKKDKKKMLKNAGIQIEKVHLHYPRVNQIQLLHIMFNYC